MCGIAGFLGAFEAKLLKQFNNLQAHRGPDGHAIWHEPKAEVGLAHRRLSIIDLSTAASQPMQAVNGRYTIVFNGEIYNYQSLVPELKAKKYQFNENSDTAVLAPLYDLYGVEMLDKLEGIFAFAIWDAKEQELFIARDHLGIKPLYYANTAKGLVFASEIKVLRKFGEGIDGQALAEYLTFLWTPSNRTMLENIHKLRPGHYLKAKRTKKKTQINLQRWYQPPQAPLDATGKPVYDPNKTPHQLGHLFDFVVKEQSISDVPVGAFLSGGVDSSAIIASMAAGDFAPQKGYCMRFDEGGMASEGFSEDIDYAREIAGRYNIMLSEVRVTAKDCLARLPSLATMLDEPCADPAPLFVEDICKAARADGLKVLMSGTGGDDVMTGYRRHQTARIRQRLGSFSGAVGAGMKTASKLLSGARKRRAQRLAGLLQANDEDFLRLAFMTNSQPDGWELMHADLREQVAEEWENDLVLAAVESQGQDLVNRTLYAELFGFLPDHNLNYTDKASMASGVEVRVPFTDRRLLNFMADVDPARKMVGLDAKAFFKQSQKDRIPSRILNRSKTGFGAPIRGWLVGPGRGLVEETLFNSKTAAQMFDLARSRKFWEATRAGQVDGAYTILAMCMACWWQDQA